MEGHDQRFKVLIREFLLEFLCLFFGPRSWSWPPRGMDGHSLRKFLAPFAVLGAQAALVAGVTRSFGKVIKSLGWRLKFRRKMYLLVQKVT